MLNIIVFGPPCSGKGTQSERIAALFNLIHISTGELFRDEIKRQTITGKLAQDYINKGELVPDNIVLKEIYHKVRKKTGNQGVVFDGFPRTQHQALILDKSLKKRKLKISLVVYIEVEEAELANRLCNRNKNSVRSDDSFEILKNRIVVYKEQTFPLLEYYKKEHKLITICGMAPVENVFSNIAEAINKYIEGLEE